MEYEDGVWRCNKRLAVKECKKKDAKLYYGGRESLGHLTSSDVGQRGR